MGRIAYAPIKPAKGVAKQRPCVALMEKPGDADRFIVIGVTSDGGNYDPANQKRYPPDIYFPLPNDQDNPTPATTGLPVRCAAYAEFVQDFARDELRATQGYVERAVLDSLIAWIQAYIAKQRKPGG